MLALLSSIGLFFVDEIGYDGDNVVTVIAPINGTVAPVNTRVRVNLYIKWSDAKDPDLQFKLININKEEAEFDKIYLTSEVLEIKPKKNLKPGKWKLLIQTLHSDDSEAIWRELVSVMVNLNIDKKAPIFEGLQSMVTSATL